MKFLCNIKNLKKNLVNSIPGNTIQGVSAKSFEPNISIICQRIFMKFKRQIF
jgi:hypothetical protein